MDPAARASLPDKDGSLTAPQAFFDGEWLAQATPAAVHALLDQGADLRAQDEDGRTPLYGAVWNEPAVVALLLTRGAEINTRDDRGQTPLHWALLSKRSKLNIESLGAAAGETHNPVDVFDPAYRQTIKMLAARAGRTVEMLLQEALHDPFPKYQIDLKT